jgi:formylglycine-generating enzyme required for sulfatase activity/energy-coupling factor transporter ATP-binding protein EcfA2
MPDELAGRLRKLQDLLDDEVIDADAYEAGLAKLRAQHGADAVDALLRQGVAPPAPRSHSQQIGGYATIQQAIAGDVHGDIYIVGERAESTRVLLAGYMRWLASQCGQLPLRGVREQKSATDVLQVGLDQVYTQLATTDQVEREYIKGPALKQFNAENYLGKHTRELLLPGQQRLFLNRPKTRYEAFDEVRDNIRSRESYRLGNRPHQSMRTEDSDVLVTTPIESLSSDILSNIQEQVQWLEFFGPQLVTEAIASNPRLVLLGEPGSGKSTALRYLALMLAQAGLDPDRALAAQLDGWGALGEAGKLIPVFMPLLPLAQRLAAQPGRAGSAADLWGAIDAHLTSHGATAEVLTAMRAELARGHVLLLLDGLDEVAGDDSRRQVAQAVLGFAAEQPRCRMVVACRVRAYEGEHNAAWQLPGWPSATLADWVPGQVHAFIGAWYTAAAAASQMPEAKRDERIAVLRRAAAEREDLRRLSLRPLLLTIMALVHLNDGRLPEDRVSLYSRCLDILLGQWEIGGKDETVYGTLMKYIDLPDADVKMLRPLLARAAYAAQQAAAPGKVGRLRRADLRELVADGLAQLKHPNPYEGAKRFLEYTDVRSGLLQASDAGDAYAFPHQTFQEYLAGLELISGPRFVDQIMERRHDDRWRVPILLGIGHAVSEGLLAAPYQLLSRLLHATKRDEPQRQRDLMLAAEIAADVGWDRLERGGEEFGALRTELAKALAQVVQGSALPAAERVQAGVYLGQLGDLRPGVCDLPPAMVAFEGGMFLIGIPPIDEQVVAKQYAQAGYSKDDARKWAKSEVNNQPVTLPAFALARYPLTNAQYARFIDADGYQPAQPWWDTADQQWLRSNSRTQPSRWDDERFGQSRPNHPVVGVTWYEAMAFCRWLTQTLNDGFVYTLPSEAEWEYAARGTMRRIYPWGNQTPDGEWANYERTHGGTTAVGCFAAGATPEGVLDLAGNVWEWTRSAFRPYPYNPEDGRESLDEPAEKRLTLRGGGWDYLPILLRASDRFNYSPDRHVSVIGFRLARHPSV